MMHEGHRQRLKERFINEGLDNFNDHQILELLLFFSIPRKDTNETAHLLIERFKTLSNIFEADITELVKIPGIGENSALLLTLIPQLSRVYFKDRWRDKPVLDSSTKAGEYMISLFVGAKYEKFYVLCLDSQNRVNHCALVHEGTINEAPVYPRLIVETALSHKANSVIISHNHPGGSCKPSEADILCTKKIKSALEAISISVLDHIIVAGEKYISLAQEGYL